MIFGILEQGSSPYNIPMFAIADCLMLSGRSDSLLLAPFASFAGGEGVSTISSNCFTASNGFTVKFEHAR